MDVCICGGLNRCKIAFTLGTSRTLVGTMIAALALQCWTASFRVIVSSPQKYPGFMIARILFTPLTLTLD